MGIKEVEADDKAVADSEHKMLDQPSLKAMPAYRPLKDDLALARKNFTSFRATSTFTGDSNSSTRKVEKKD